MSRIDEYINDIESQIEILERRLNSLNEKFFEWGTESEIKFIRFLIKKENNLLLECMEYRRELTSFK